jgi:dTDP-4-amino-4,6-dideoxygalactose transaminase
MAKKPEKPIAFIDLATQRDVIGVDRIDAALHNVVMHGRYVMGDEITDLESKLASYCGSKHSLGCASGTDALVLAMMAWGVGPGDAVFVPSFTFVATAEAVVLLGATPVFVDVKEDTFNMDVEDLKRAIAETKKTDLNLKLVVPVDIFGQPADFDAIEPVAKSEGMKVLVDAAQSFGASLNGKKVGSMGDMATTSFFPAKPLGCYGDGGAVFCHDEQTLDVLKSLRVHGMGGDKYDNIRIGVNGRLDTMQAAILLLKLEILEKEIPMREAVAKRYRDGLPKYRHQHIITGAQSAWAQYTMLVENRDELQEFLRGKDIPTAAYYPKPVHRQTAYQKFNNRELPVCDMLAGKVISAPMHPYLKEDVQDYIIEGFNEFLK